MCLNVCISLLHQTGAVFPLQLFNCRRLVSDCFLMLIGKSEKKPRNRVDFYANMGQTMDDRDRRQLIFRS